MTKVRCKVSSCHYWGAGEVCNADSISVNNNIFDDMGIEDEYADEMSYAFDTEVGYEVGMENNRNMLQGFKNEIIADTSQQTQCETMRPRGTK